MRRLFIKSLLLAAIAVPASGAAARDIEWSSPDSGSDMHSNEFKTAFVVSDEAARVVIDLFSSAADSVGDATQGNNREEEDESSPGVEIESVEDLDVKTGRPAKKHRPLDENR